MVSERAPSSGRLRPWIRTLRPHQWAKNTLLFVPAILAHRYDDLALIADLGVAFVSFSACASAVYALNDVLDLDADRKHRTKRNRPLASGALSVRSVIALALASLAASVVLAGLVLRAEFLKVIAGYFAISLLYATYLKRMLLIDVITLALLFTYRVIAGGIAASVEVSFWLLAFSLFFFTGLAFAKRYGEIRSLAEPSGTSRSAETVPGRDYRVHDLEIIRAIGPACGVAAVLVLCLYIHGPEVTKLYRHEELLYFIAPVLLYWIGRVWFLAGREELDDDPVVFALRDPASIASGSLIAALVIAARLSW